MAKHVEWHLIGYVAILSLCNGHLKSLVSFKFSTFLSLNQTQSSSSSQHFAFIALSLSFVTSTREFPLNSLEQIAWWKKQHKYQHTNRLIGLNEGKFQCVFPKWPPLKPPQLNVAPHCHADPGHSSVSSLPPCTDLPRILYGARSQKPLCGYKTIRHFWHATERDRGREG